MIILRHDAGYFTLYGHLSAGRLEYVRDGQEIAEGEQIGSVGAPPVNGNWPPHLQFQQINDLMGLGAGFPGVAAKSELEHWLALCPCPAGFFPEMDPKALEYDTCS